MRAGVKRTAAGWNFGTSKCKAASSACCPCSIERSFSRLPARPITASPSLSSGRRIFGGDQSRFIFTPTDARTRGHLLTRRVSIPRSGKSGRVGATDLRRPRQRRVGTEGERESSDLGLHSDRQRAIGDCKQMLKVKPIRVALGKLKEC